MYSKHIHFWTISLATSDNSLIILTSIMEEEVRFELTELLHPSVFKTDALNRSATLPHLNTLHPINESAWRSRAMVYPLSLNCHSIDPFTTGVLRALLRSSQGNSPLVLPLRLVQTIRVIIHSSFRHMTRHELKGYPPRKSMSLFFNSFRLNMLFCD